MSAVFIYHAHYESYRAVKGRDDGRAAAFVSDCLEELGYDSCISVGSPEQVAAAFEQLRSQQPLLAAIMTCNIHNTTESANIGRMIQNTSGIPVIACGPAVVVDNEEFRTASECRGYISDNWAQHLRASLDGTRRTREENTTPQVPRTTASREKTVASISGMDPWLGCGYCIRGRTVKSGNAIEAEVQQILASENSPRFIPFVDSDFLEDRRRGAEIGRILGRRRKTHPFAWGIQSSPGSLMKAEALLSELVEGGLVRVEMAVNHPDDSAIEAVRLCCQAGVAQVAGHFVMDRIPLRTETPIATIEHAKRMLHAAPGCFEPGLSLLLPSAHAARSGCYNTCPLSLNNSVSLTDYPRSPIAYENADHSWPLRLQHLFRTEVLDSMFELATTLPVERITPHFAIHEQFGLESIWYGEIFEKDRILCNYFTLLIQGGAKRSIDIGSDNLLTWHPQRSVSIWASMDFANSYPRLLGQVLSPLEYELLLHCSGKQTLAQILHALFPCFGSLFDSFAAFRDMVTEILGNFEKNRWLVFVEL